VRRFEEAETVCRRAIALEPQSFRAYNNLGNALYAQGEREEGEAAYHKSIALNPDFGAAHCNLGNALMLRGEYSEAAESLTKAVHLLPGGTPNGELARSLLEECQRFVALEARLPAIIDGTEKATDAHELIELARMCLRKSLDEAAARCFLDAFEINPQLAEEPQTGCRYDAACAAALAGCGRSEDATELDDAERAQWRARARLWLKADLARRSATATGNARARSFEVSTLEHWRVDPDLAGLRDPSSIATLPESERDECLAIWSEVDALLERLRRP